LEPSTTKVLKIFFDGSTKGEKVVLFGLSTCTKGERLNFYSSNILNSTGTTFSPLGPVQSPQEIEAKKTKMYFFWVFVPVQILYFWA
jgi:hypothetical protein